MKHLNNYGFAITSILYALLTMVALILFLLIGLESFRWQSSDDFVDEIAEELNICVEDGSC